MALVLVAILAPCGTAAAELPEPPRAAGFRLIAWRAVVDYCRTLDDASDRVLARGPGRTTEDRPYLVAVVAAPETIRDLDHFRGLQRRRRRAPGRRAEQGRRPDHRLDPPGSDGGRAGQREEERGPDRRPP